MKKVVCEVCGCQNVLKTGGVFVCQECGMQYDLEEAKKLLTEIGTNIQGNEPATASEKQAADKSNAIPDTTAEDGASTPTCYPAEESLPPSDPITEKNISIIDQLLKQEKTVGAMKALCDITGIKSGEAAKAINDGTWRNLDLSKKAYSSTPSKQRDRKCPICHAPLGESLKVCPSCGADIEAIDMLPPKMRTLVSASNSLEKEQRRRNEEALARYREDRREQTDGPTLEQRREMMALDGHGQTQSAVTHNAAQTKYESKSEKRKRIVKTRIIGSGDQKSAASAVGRAAVGGFLLGPIGLLAGASAKSKNRVTFAITYADGHIDTQTVNAESYLCKEYCKYLDDQSGQTE